MRRRSIVIGATVGLLLATATVATAAATSTPVSCTLTDSTLSCPLPQAAPTTVTKTVTKTKTVTAQPSSSSSAQSSSSAPSSTSVPTTSSTSAPPSTSWPDSSNTGVPASVTLSPWSGTPYDGACYLNTDNEIVDSVEFTGCDVVIMANNVTIKRSKINGHLGLDTDRSESANWSVTIEDSVIDAGQSFGAAVSNGNITIRRSEIKGGQTIVQCTNGSTHCDVEDSWLHGQSIPPMDGEPHLGGVLNSGGPNFTIRHNRIDCDNNNGCTGDVVMLPDFAPITNSLIENNLLGASPYLAYCTYGGWRPNDNANQNHDIVYRGNVFQRGDNAQCGAYGPVTGWRDNPGNAWTDNIWDDGTPVPPAS